MPMPSPQRAAAPKRLTANEMALNGLRRVSACDSRNRESLDIVLSEHSGTAASLQPSEAPRNLAVDDLRKTQFALAHKSRNAAAVVQPMLAQVLF